MATSLRWRTHSARTNLSICLSVFLSYVPLGSPYIHKYCTGRDDFGQFVSSYGQFGLNIN
jgi:hypothetical protein